jgi:hypothetical protein
MPRTSGSVAALYDGPAADYHLAYGGNWESAIDLQGAALDALIRDGLPGAKDVLECSCGIATQVIGLARLGYRVLGTDIGHGAIRWPTERTVVGDQQVMTAVNR